MKLYYPAVIHKDTDGTWLDFPDLEGCQTFADTTEELLTYAKEALTAYCLEYLATNKALPNASDFTQIRLEKNEAIVLIEAVLTDKTKSVKKTLTIPAWLNDMAENENINFSALLQEALSQRLNL